MEALTLKAFGRTVYTKSGALAYPGKRRYVVVSCRPAAIAQDGQWYVAFAAKETSSDRRAVAVKSARAMLPHVGIGVVMFVLDTHTGVEEEVR